MPHIWAYSRQRAETQSPWQTQHEVSGEHLFSLMPWPAWKCKTKSNIMETRQLSNGLLHIQLTHASSASPAHGPCKVKGLHLQMPPSDPCIGILHVVQPLLAPLAWSKQEMNVLPKKARSPLSNPSVYKTQGRKKFGDWCKGLFFPWNLESAVALGEIHGPGKMNLATPVTHQEKIWIVIQFINCIHLVEVHTKLDSPWALGTCSSLWTICLFLASQAYFSNSSNPDRRTICFVLLSNKVCVARQWWKHVQNLNCNLATSALWNGTWWSPRGTGVKSAVFEKH